MWLDSHCHLNHEKLTETYEVSDVVDLAQKANLQGMLTICCKIHEEYQSLLEICSSYKNVWCSIGTHPHDASLDKEKNISLEQLISYASSDPKIIAIGESGLDYFYMNSSQEDQESSFRKHIRACIKTGLPLVVHSRDAEQDTARIIKEEMQSQENGQSLKGVMHCFSSKQELAIAALEIGFYISFSGIITFKKSTELQEIAKTIPLEKVLVETDAPYLAPQPFRGQTNIPSYVTHTGEFLADLLQIDANELAKITTDNFFNLFDKAKDTWEQQ